MPFATFDDVQTRMLRPLTTEEKDSAEAVIEIVTSLIVDAVDKDLAWSDDLDTIPPALKALCVEKARMAILNASGVVSRTLGQSSVTFSRSLDGDPIFLTNMERAIAREAVLGTPNISPRTPPIEDALYPPEIDPFFFDPAA
jgi:hypothetical protein